MNFSEQTAPLSDWMVVLIVFSIVGSAIFGRHMKKRTFKRILNILKISKLFSDQINNNPNDDNERDNESDLNDNLNDINLTEINLNESSSNEISK